MEDSIVIPSFQQLLVTEIRQHPWLYDKTRPDFRDRTIRHNSWRAIAKKLHVRVEDCQRSWRSIRDRYTKECRTAKKQNKGAETSAQWSLMKHLGFLKGHIRHREKKQTLSEYSDSGEEAQEEEGNETENATNLLEVIANPTEVCIPTADSQDHVYFSQDVTSVPRIITYGKLYPVVTSDTFEEVPNSVGITIKQSVSAGEPEVLAAPNHYAKHKNWESSSSDEDRRKASNKKKKSSHGTKNHDDDDDDNLSSEIISILRAASQKMEQLSASCSRPHLNIEDCDHLFLLSQYDILKSLPEPLKQEAKIKIQQILYELKCKM